MATNRKPPKSDKIPETAAVKEAKAALQQSKALGLEASQVRTAQQSRGAYRQRRLRSGGTDLAGYLIGGYADDPMPKPPKPPKPKPKPKPTPKPKPKPKPTPKPRVPAYTKKQRVAKQNKLSDARGREMERIRKERERKAAAARAAAKARKTQQTKVLPGGKVML